MKQSGTRWLVQLIKYGWLLYSIDNLAKIEIYMYIHHHTQYMFCFKPVGHANSESMLRKKIDSPIWQKTILWSWSDRTRPARNRLWNRRVHEKYILILMTNFKTKSFAIICYYLKQFRIYICMWTIDIFRLNECTAIITIVFAKYFASKIWFAYGFHLFHTCLTCDMKAYIWLA